MTSIIFHDTKNRKHEISGYLLREVPTEGQETPHYLLKDALRRVFDGTSRTRRIKIRTSTSFFWVGVTEYTNGNLAIGCHLFQRMEACIIRGWAFE